MSEKVCCINGDIELFKPDDFNLTLIKKGKNSRGNNWYVYAKPNGRYAYMYKNKNGSTYWHDNETSHYIGFFNQWHRNHQSMEALGSCTFFDKRNAMKYCQDYICDGDDMHYDDFEPTSLE